MSVHGDDVVMAIRRGLLQYPTCESMTDVRIEPNPEQGWPNRDGRLQFDAVGRDWTRAFRITVEAIPTNKTGYLTDVARPDGSFDVAKPEDYPC